MSAEPRADLATPCAACGSALDAAAACVVCGARASRTTLPQPYVGLCIADRFEVGEVLRVGGMGRVHRGVQTALGRAVAIKFIHPHLLGAPEIVQRFILEARAVSRLSHPNIVRVLDFGRLPESEGGVPYTVMELLSGPSLADVLRDERVLAPSRAIAVALQTLAALDEAHGRGVIHRDVKPENVLLESPGGAPDHVKVIDFGLARVLGTSRITAAGFALGTPGYMAPEQLSGAKPSPAADLYGVGAMLFESLAGRLPFIGSTAADVAYAQLTGPCPDPRDVRPGLDVNDALVAALQRVLDPEPSARFASAAEFAAALSSAIGASPSRPPRAVSERVATTATVPHRDTPSELPLTERGSAMAWARGWLGQHARAASALLWGPPGAGRSRLLREIARAATVQGFRVCVARVDPEPASLARYAGIARITAALLGGDTRRLRDESLGAEADFGMSVLFDGAERPADPAGEVRAVVAALAAAARAAVSVRPGTSLLLAIDDVHRMDGLSRRILSEWRARARPTEVIVLGTAAAGSEPDAADWGERCAVPCLSAAAASRLLDSTSGAEVLARAECIEPAWVEHLRRWSCERTGQRPPERLAELVAARIESLPARERRVLEAIAIVGRIAIEALPVLLRVESVLPATLARLHDLGFVRVDGGVASVASSLVARSALEMLPAGVALELHAAASHWGAPEVRAHHALRGHGDFAAFLLAERAVDALERRGDRPGAEALLADATRAARTQWCRSGEDEAASAWVAFARRHAEALLGRGDAERAFGLLAETVDVPSCTGEVRTRVLALLSDAAARRGWRDVAARYAMQARESQPMRVTGRSA